MSNYNLIVSAQGAQNSQASAVTLPLTQEQFSKLLGDPAHPVKLTASLFAEMLTEAEIQVDERTRAAIVTGGVKPGDYALLSERQDGGNMDHVLYQYVVAPDGKCGLLRAHCLRYSHCFDESGSNIYAQSTLKKFVDYWAERQNFGTFVEEVSLLELPRADDSDEAAQENHYYVWLLRLASELDYFWTKTAYSANAWSVWCVDAGNSTRLVDTYGVDHYYGVSPVLWLASDVSIGGGHGTRTSPRRVVAKCSGKEVKSACGARSAP